MPRRWAVLPLLLAVCIPLVLTGCLDKDGAAVASGQEQSRADWTKQKLEEYTQKSFRFVELLEVAEEEGAYRIRLSYIPEAGSAPIKEDIYRAMAVYAWSIGQFFPEVKRYEFSVLWDEQAKLTVIQAIIDEEAVAQLDERYAGIRMDLESQLDVSWRSFFSPVTESGEAQKWHEKESGV